MKISYYCHFKSSDWIIAVLLLIRFFYACLNFNFSVDYILYFCSLKQKWCLCLTHQSISRCCQMHPLRLSSSFSLCIWIVDYMFHCFCIYRSKFMHQLGLYRHGQFRRNVIFYVRSEQVPSAPNSPCQGMWGFAFAFPNWVDF